MFACRCCSSAFPCTTRLQAYNPFASPQAFMQVIRNLAAFYHGNISPKGII